MSDRVRVGLLGAGFAAALAAEALRKTEGVDVELVAVSSRDLARAEPFARRWGVGRATSDAAEVCGDGGIDLVCVCAPNAAHAPLIVAALDAGKHVVCEKPLTGAFGTSELRGVERALDERTTALAAVADIRAAAARNGRQVMYAENWVYSPAIAKVARLVQRSGARILDLRAEESHSGSHAPLSRRRSTAGGGSLMVLGSHPIGAALHLKRQEAKALGTPPAVVSSVTCEVARLDTRLGSGEPAPWLVSDWDDVETWATAVLAFSDGTRASITASFAMLGGVVNRLEAYTTTGAFRANLTPNDMLLAYTPDSTAFDGEYLHEKLEARTGWMSVSPDEDWVRGYPQEMQAFLHSAVTGEPPDSDLELAAQVVDVIYAGYLSAEQGTRVPLTSDPTAEGTATS